MTAVPRKVLVVENVSFRQSELKELLMCGLRYRHGVLEGRPREATSALVGGTALHYAAEKLIGDKQSGIELGVLQDPDVLEELFVSSWADAEARQIEESSTGDIRWDDPKEKIAAKVFVAVEHFANNVLPDLVPVASEVRFSDLEVAPGVTIEGTIDLIEAGPKLKDWKTAKRAWRKADLKHDIQSRMYTLAYHELFGSYPDSFEYYVYVLGYEPRLETYDATRTPDEIERFRWQLQHHAEQVRERALYANTTGWWCSERWCAFYEECPAGGGPIPSQSREQEDVLSSGAGSPGVDLDLWEDNGTVLELLRKEPVSE